MAERNIRQVRRRRPGLGLRLHSDANERHDSQASKDSHLSHFGADRPSHGHASGLSIMPEGLESAFTPQQLADVIAYVLGR